MQLALYWHLYMKVAIVMITLRAYSVMQMAGTIEG